MARFGGQNVFRYETLLRMANRTKATREKLLVFLDVLRQCANVTEGAKAIGMGRQHMYRIKEDDAAFSAEWDEAEQEGIDRLEREMWRRAVEGTDKPVYQQGVLVGSVREYSDSLAMFLAKGHRPKKYRERTEISGPDGGAIRLDVHEMSDAELAAIAAKGN
jgi:hypothetical protein